MSYIEVLGGVKDEMKVEINCEIQDDADNIVEIGPNDIINNESDEDYDEEKAVKVDYDNNHLVQYKKQLNEIKNINVNTEQVAPKGAKLDVSSDAGNPVRDENRNFKVKNNLQLAESLILNYSVNNDLIDGKKKAQLQEPIHEIDVITSKNWPYKYRTREGTVIDEEDQHKIRKNSVPTSFVSSSEYTEEDDDKFRCNHCKFVTSTKRYVSKHIRTRHRDKTKTYECPYCPFKSKYYPRYHIISAHKTESELAWFRCYKCDFKTKLKSGLSEHMMCHYDPSEMMDLMKKCDKCPKMFKKRDTLRRHKLLVHERDNLKLLKCLECEYETYFTEPLKNHIEVCHSDIQSLETLQCPKCPFKTKFKKKFFSHKSTKHRERVQCEKCGYQTHSMDRMQLHMITHKAVKDDADLKYRCDKCDYKTYRTYSLQIHKLNHLKPEEIQYFYCYHCNFKAKRKDNLKTHVLKHFKNSEVIFDCYICDFTTKKRHMLINHIDKHSKEQNMKSKGDKSSEEPPKEQKNRSSQAPTKGYIRKRKAKNKAGPTKIKHTKKTEDSPETS